MRTKWYTLALGTVLALGLTAWTAPTALAQHGHGGGGHGGGGHGGGHAGWSGGHGGGHGGWGGWGGVGIHIGGYPYIGRGYGYGYGYPGYYGGYDYAPVYSYSAPYYDTYDDTYPGAYTDTNSYESYYPPQQYNSQPAAPAQTVTINDAGFMPKTLNLTHGTTVRFVNQGQQQHGLAQPQNNWKTNNLSQGQSYTWTFSEPGTYDLQDSMNPNNRMTVTVQ